MINFGTQAQTLAFLPFAIAYIRISEIGIEKFADSELHLHAAQRLRRDTRAKLEGCALAMRPLVALCAILRGRLRVLVEIDDELAIAHQRLQAHVSFFYLRAHQHFQREEMLVVRLRQVTVHKLSQPVTIRVNAPSCITFAALLIKR